MINRLLKKLLRLRNRYFLILDAITFCFTPILALYLRLDGSVALEEYKSGLVAATILFLFVKLSVFYAFGFYRHYWRYASIDELVKIAILTGSVAIGQTVLFTALHSSNAFSINSLPRSLPLLDGMLSLILVGGIRFSIRVLERTEQRQRKFHRGDRVLIVGAGNTGVSLALEMQRNPQLGLCPVAFIDDDPEKLNMRIRGLPVIGDRYKIPEVVRSLNIRSVIIAMPTAPGRVIREIVDICQANEIKTSTLPGIDELLNGRVRLGSIREVKIEDLLRREPIQTDVEKVFALLKGKKVLITGAGGSIGSELCRQIFKAGPAEMMLLGHGENSVFTIQQELKQVSQTLKKEGKVQGRAPRIIPFIADLRFLYRLDCAFEQFRPEIIFHAAAHKHVPLMELNPPEAITNNVLGTKNLLELALRYDVGQLVMISTDKAVNPSSVMGTSKRVAEMLVLQAAQTSGKPFSVVRFGNVLGSRGSVIPTFTRQIAAGGPVTVTHPDICRYFMTIPEAVQLVLQASALSSGGEVFMLKMGQPVKIVDLAKDLIRLSGYEVGRDIEIAFTGLRPGEKLFEELFVEGEQYEPTEHEKLVAVRNAKSRISENLDCAVESLLMAAANNDSNLIIFLLDQLVPGYTPKYADAPVGAGVSQEGVAKATKNGKTLEKVLCEGNNKVIYTDTKLYSPEVALLEKGRREKTIPNHHQEDLHRALKRQEFRLYYQPIMALETSKIVGFEALLRWQHPELGIISPAKFMPVAEESDLIIPIGWWVLGEVCHQLRVWQEEFYVESPLTISVNLSPRQLLQSDLVEQIDKIIEETSLNASSLRLEISESFIRENPDAATTVLPQLRALGVRLQIDNFGRSHLFYSERHGFGNLLAEQFDGLKVDRFLVSRIEQDDESLEVFKAIARNAGDLGLKVIAAGIETPEQLDKVRGIQCPYGQGYFFSKPLEGEAAKTLVGAQ